MNFTPPSGSTNPPETFGTCVFMGVVYSLKTSKWYSVLHAPALVLDDDSCFTDGVFLVHASCRLKFEPFALVEKDYAAEILHSIIAALTENSDSRVQASVDRAVEEAPLTLSDLIICVDAITNSTAVSSQANALLIEGVEECKDSEVLTRKNVYFIFIFYL